MMRNIDENHNICGWGFFDNEFHSIDWWTFFLLRRMIQRFIKKPSKFLSFVAFFDLTWVAKSFQRVSFWKLGGVCTQCVLRNIAISRLWFLSYENQWLLFFFANPRCSLPVGLAVEFRRRIDDTVLKRRNWERTAKIRSEPIEFHQLGENLTYSGWRRNAQLYHILSRWREPKIIFLIKSFGDKRSVEEVIEEFSKWDILSLNLSSHGRNWACRVRRWKWWCYHGDLDDMVMMKMIMRGNLV